MPVPVFQPLLPELCSGISVIFHKFGIAIKKHLCYICVNKE